MPFSYLPYALGSHDKAFNWKCVRVFDMLYRLLLSKSPLLPFLVAVLHSTEYDFGDLQA